ADWQPYPWYYKYGPWRYNFSNPVYRGGRIISPEPDPPANFDFMIGSSNAVMIYNKLFNAGLREGLDLTKATLEPELAIAQEHAPDYTSWVFKIPQNVKFQNKAPVNGRQMTADDVAYSFQRHLQDNISRAALKTITRVTAPDPSTVRFDMSQPTLNLPATLSSNQFVVFAKEAYENPDFYKKNPIG